MISTSRESDATASNTTTASTASTASHSSCQEPSSEQAGATTTEKQHDEKASTRNRDRKDDVGGRVTGISKAFSKILRHDAERVGLALDARGYARLDELLQQKRLKSLKVTFQDVQTFVNTNQKQRFDLKLNEVAMPPPPADSTNPADYLIRANQGHSIAIEAAALLTPITLEAGNIPPVVVHGTYYGSYAGICAGGLKPMGRNHLHCSTGLPEDTSVGGGDEGEGAKVISGMRADAELLFYIDVRKSLEDGAARWWMSDNGVVLTEGGEEGCVGSEYWSRVVGRRQDVGVLWEDGVEVAELPVALRDRRTPSGKGPRGVLKERGGAKGSGAKSKRGGRNKELEVLGGGDELGVQI